MITLNSFADFSGIRHGFYTAGESVGMTDILLMNQVHSADVLVVDRMPDFAPSVDALVTTCLGINLAVKTADCAPVLFADPVNGVIGAAHAGWKGAYQGVMESTVLTMLSKGASLDHIYVGIGPHLQKKSFEVHSTMLDLFPVTQHHFFERQPDGRILFDFNAYLLYRLNQMGLKYIESIPVDTYSDHDYLSYRRDPKNPARQYSTICLR